MPSRPNWKGACQAGANFPATACNNKLIGARYFVEGFGAQNLNAGEFLSPRDANGHGSHVAATAAGNYGVAPTIGGHNLGIAKVSGIAPRARIAAYKVCWTGTAPSGEAVEGSCMASDAVAAIDAAVADGVDVINYSVGSATSAVFGPVERAFLGAAAAGVFVANAAGNDGPEARHHRVADRRAVGHLGGRHHARPHVRVDVHGRRPGPAPAALRSVPWMR